MWESRLPCIYKDYSVWIESTLKYIQSHSSKNTYCYVRERSGNAQYPLLLLLKSTTLVCKDTRVHDTDVTRYTSIFHLWSVRERETERVLGAKVDEPVWIRLLCQVQARYMEQPTCYCGGRMYEAIPWRQTPVAGGYWRSSGCDGACQHRHRLSTSTSQQDQTYSPHRSILTQLLPYQRSYKFKQPLQY